MSSDGKEFHSLIIWEKKDNMRKKGMMVGWGQGICDKICVGGL